MIRLIIAVLVVFLVVIYPVMLAARMVGAARTGPGSAVFAVLLQAIFGVLVQLAIPIPLLQGITAVVIGSVIYSLILQTTIFRGFAISVIAVVIGVLGLLLFAGIAGALGV